MLGTLRKSGSTFFHIWTGIEIGSRESSALVSHIPSTPLYLRGIR
ncbi:9940_t:CDS:2 [Funneliformis geosporum]|uniref:9940_t:CDS:1 n=1 Tax=Funneliformis geosporum TaxID=1117311 RepID=A0A9W4SE86_9GLOM|nr:9940_t:CDS:2 [Funneliformis geosporum]